MRTFLTYFVFLHYLEIINIMLNSIWKDYTLLGYFMHNLLQPLSTSTILIYLTSNI